MSKIVNILLILGLVLIISCIKKEETNTPEPISITMNATETALVGQWSWDRTETYNSTNGLLSTIQYSNGDYETYNNGNLTGTENNNPSYYYYKFLNTSYQKEGVSLEQRWFDLKLNANGDLSDGAWVVKINYSGSGKDFIQVPFNAYIYTLSTTELITRNNTNSELFGTIIKYYHKL
ncbi:MAG: hypothetical protein HY951_15980 [Bacteroidia bacterium]|nr:hypothetical protein [Bacteroidia bacterium]